MRSFGSLFKNIHPLQATEYALLIAVAAVLPFSWHISFYLLTLLVINAIISAIVTKRLGIRNLRRLGWISLVAMGVLPLVYLVSLIYTSNMAEGKAEVARKMLLLAYAITFLLFDWSFLSRKHILGILQFMTAALLVRFVIRLGISAHTIASGGMPLSQCVGFFFDPMHHGYLSMYILLAISYLAYIALYQENTNKIFLYISTTVSIIALTAYLFILQSRSGLLGLSIVAIGIILLIFLELKRYRLGVFLSCIAVAVVFAALLTPLTHHRLADTLAKVITQDKSDERYIISRASLNVVKANLPWGVGAGDRIDELVDEYHRIGAEKQYWRRYNPHNQYVDTLMTTGIVGLLVLLAVFIVPLVDCILSKNHLFAFFLLVIATSALFESILERQMGINFFCFFYCLFIVENKEYNKIDTCLTSHLSEPLDTSHHDTSKPSPTQATTL